MKPAPSQESHAARVIEAKQRTFDEVLAEKSQAQRGTTCEALDMPRFNEQAARVYTVMRFLGTHTLRQLSAMTGDPEASISARIREIRHYLEENGLGTIIRARVEGGNGLHSYSMRLHRTFGKA